MDIEDKINYWLQMELVIIFLSILFNFYQHHVQIIHRKFLIGPLNQVSNFHSPLL